MKLTGKQMAEIHAALLSGFVSSQDLAIMVKFELDVQLSEITAGDTLSHIVFNLINWAETTGKLSDLIYGASEYNPGNPELQALVRRFKQWSEPPQPTNTGTPPLTIDIIPPPEPQRPPQLGRFVGREHELSYYTSEVSRYGIAVIAGMPGVGKTALAVALANQLADVKAIFWHSFRPEEGIEVLIWKLAGFLSWNGRSELWQMLQGFKHPGAQRPPLDVMFDFALQIVRGQEYLLCLDDFQYVDQDPLLDELIERMQPLLLNQEVSLIITSRRLPSFVRLDDFVPLKGLNLNDTDQLVKACGLSLSASSIINLHTYIDGNAALLTMAIDTIARATDPEEMVRQVGLADNIERYLLDELDRYLTEQERQVETAIAIMEYPATRDAIESILTQTELYRTLYDLCGRFLLRSQRGNRDREYNQQAILREFYYEKPTRLFRRKTHERIAEYYEHESIDRFKAAWHHARAGNYTQSAQLVASNIWECLNRGYANPLRLLLDQLLLENLPIQYYIEISIAKGEVCALLGESQQAEASFRKAQELLEAQINLTGVNKQKIRTFIGLGNLLKDSNPQNALQLLQKALSLVSHKDVDNLTVADIHIRIGLVQTNLGNFTAAKTSLEQGLMLIPDAPLPLRSTALLNIGNIYAYQGDMQQSSEYYERARRISEQIGDHYQLTAILLNLGTDQAILGKWGKAFETFIQAYRHAQLIGDMLRLTLCELNLGNLYLRKGEKENAKNHLLECLRLAQTHNYRRQFILANSSLADLFLRNVGEKQADCYLTEAEKVANELAAESELIEIYRLWAQFHLQSEKFEEAFTSINQSIQLAVKHGMMIEEGTSQRILGNVLTAAKRFSDASAAFQRSVELLNERDPYEAARTKLYWGIAVLSQGENMSQAQELLSQAKATFQNLEAQQDLEVTQKYLQGIQ